MNNKQVSTCAIILIIGILLLNCIRKKNKNVEHWPDWVDNIVDSGEQLYDQGSTMVDTALTTVVDTGGQLADQYLDPNNAALVHQTVNQTQQSLDNLITLRDEVYDCADATINSSIDNISLCSTNPNTCRESLIQDLNDQVQNWENDIIDYQTKINEYIINAEQPLQDIFYATPAQQQQMLHDYLEQKGDDILNCLNVNCITGKVMDSIAENAASGCVEAIIEAAVTTIIACAAPEAEPVLFFAELFEGAETAIDCGIAGIEIICALRLAIKCGLSDPRFAFIYQDTIIIDCLVGSPRTAPNPMPQATRDYLRSLADSSACSTLYNSQILSNHCPVP